MTSSLVVLTLATEGGGPLARQLSTAGLQVEHWPLVRLEPVAMESIRPVLERLPRYHWVFLPSPSAVRLVARRMKELGVAWPANVRAGLVGPGSVEAFRECFGSRPSVDSPARPPHDAVHLVQSLVARVGGLTAADPPVRVLVLTRPEGRARWEELRRHKAVVEVVTAYTAEPVLDGLPEHLMWRLQRTMRAGGVLTWVVGASSQLDTLLRVLPMELGRWAKQQPVVVPHAAILAHARNRGFTDGAVYDDRRGLVERLQYFSSTHGRTLEEPADTDADKEELSVVSLDQQKNASTVPGGNLADDRPANAPHPSATRQASAADAPSPAGVQPPAPASAPTSASPSPNASGPAASAGSPPPTSSVVPPSPPPPPPPTRVPPPVPPVPPPVTAPATPAGKKRGAGLWPLLVILLIGALAAGGWWYTQQRFLAADRESARRVQEAEQRASRLEEQIKTLRDSQNQLQARSSTLETKIAESATQQEQLNSLYDEIAKSRGDNVLAEVEQSVLMANQHLELTGNVKGALLALENAERRLGDSEQSQAIGVRRLILQDIERLKALPEVDLTRSAARLDEIINRIDRLPLLADAALVSRPSGSGGSEGPAGPDPQQPGGAGQPAGAQQASGASASDPAPAPAPAASEDQSALKRLYDSALQTGARGLEAVRDEFRNLVTIRRIDKPDSLLLSPEQKHAARENLKLMLLNARLNLLNRHEALFRQDLGRVAEALQRLYDTEQHDVKTTLATLQSLQAQPLALSLPSLSESIAAVKAARAASEKRS